MKKVIFGIMLLLGASQANAVVLVEDFEAAFPAWENGWLGTNSNLQNYYGIGAGRGNNPDGLWIDDGDGTRLNDTVEIIFDPTFAATLSSFTLDVTTYFQGITLEIYDTLGNTLLSTVLAVTSGAFTDPGVYENFSVSSVNGIKGFSFFTTGAQIEGGTSIDNVVVVADANVPETSSLFLFGLGLIGMGFTRKRKSS